MQSRKHALTGDGPSWVSSEERGSALLLRFLLWVARTLGRSSARLLLYPICLYYLLFAPRERRASRGYLHRVLGKPSTLRDTFRHMHTFAATLLDRAYLLSGRYDLFEVHRHGDDIVVDMNARGQGCFMLGAHLGNFEVLHAFGRGQPDLKVTLVMYEEASRQFNAVMRTIDPTHVQSVIALGRVDSILNIETALRRGEFIGMLADRSLRNDRLHECDFLGGRARFPLGPFRIARMLAVPVILMFCLYRGGARYDIHFERLVEPGEATPTEAVERYARRLEHYCRLSPYNWYNFYDFWA